MGPPSSQLFKSIHFTLSILFNIDQASTTKAAVIKKSALPVWLNLCRVPSQRPGALWASANNRGRYFPFSKLLFIILGGAAIVFFHRLSKRPHSPQTTRFSQQQATAFLVLMHVVPHCSCHCSFPVATCIFIVAWIMLSLPPRSRSLLPLSPESEAKK